MWTWGLQHSRSPTPRQPFGTYGIIHVVSGNTGLEERVLQSIEVARLAVEAVSDKQADNIVMLDTKQVCSFADYFVICSGDSARQIEAIRQEIREKLKRDGVAPSHMEGTADSGWILLDLGDVIVHIFSPSQRDYYRLDDLWHEATPIIRIQ
jgi:ribosome-associated protein